MISNSYHILVVDDDPNVLRVTALVLEKAGYSITPVLGGEAALEALDGRIYDLVLTDLNMPGADGEDVLRKARENQPQAPVIIMTANPYQLGVQCGVWDGPDTVLEKPFNLTDLLSSLEGCLSPCHSQQADGKRSDTRKGSLSASSWPPARWGGEGVTEGQNHGGRKKGGDNRLSSGTGGRKHLVPGTIPPKYCRLVS